MENPNLLQILLIFLAYLLGSFSSAITLSRIMGFPDPRSGGSNNPGATNVLRLAGKKAAALTLIGDVLKGLIPVLIAALLLENKLYVALAGFSAFLGHCFPLYYRFTGGKGVATAIGVLVAFDWPVGLVVVAIWLIVAKATSLSALAALIAFTCMPFIYYIWRGDLTVTIVLALMTLILIARHHQNIARLLSGREDKSSLSNDDRPTS